MNEGPHAEEGRASGIGCSLGCVAGSDGSRMARRASRHGIRRGDLERLVIATGGVCMLCRVCHATDVEHCHYTGRVRGLVCPPCNRRIRFLEGTDGFPAVYWGACFCVSRPGRDEAVLAWELEQATYAFLDHAMQPATHDRTEAFAWLADHPYPETGAVPEPRRRARALVPRERPSDVVRVMREALWLTGRNGTDGTGDVSPGESVARWRIGQMVRATLVGG